MQFINLLWLCLFTIILFLNSAHSINCFICNATDKFTPFQCGEWFDRYDRPEIEPQDCSAVHDAKFCIKHIGRFEAISIVCYQCSSAETLDCTDTIMSMPDAPLEPAPCDHIYEASYCIKHTNLNGVSGDSVTCYVCDTAENDCGLWLNPLQNPSMEPVDCSAVHVYDAKYCIKLIRSTKDGVAGKRYCSPIDLGNYCSYDKNSHGVIQFEYGTCTTTCLSDGCNI